MDLYNYKYMDELFLENYKKMEQLDLCTEDNLTVEEVIEGTILPYRVVGNSKKAGVVNQNGEYVALSAFEALSEVDSWGGSYQIESAEYLDETVLYFGRFWKHWGHFLMDMVSRLWWIIENDMNIKIAYDAQEDIQGVYWEFLRLLGVSKNQMVRVENPTRFAKVIVPECAHKPGISCNVRYKKIFDIVAQKALQEFEDYDKYRDKSIYFTRMQMKRRIPFEVGERDFERLFSRQGFVVVAPEKYSLVEQIAMIKGAKRVACLSGTLPHNMIFAQDGAELIVVRKTNKPNYRQVSVNQLRKLKVTNIDAHISLKAVGPGGPFVLDINKNVEAYFKDCYGKCDYSKVLQWFKRKIRLMWYVPIYILRNRKMDRQVPLFDGKVFSTTVTAKSELFSYYIKRI